MPRPSPWDLIRKPPVTLRDTYTDPEHPDLALTVTLQKPDAVEETAITALSEQLAAEWAGEDADPFPAAGEFVKLNAVFVNTAAMLMVMIVPDAGDPPFDLRECVGWARRAPNLYRSLINAAIALRAGEDPEGNRSRASHLSPGPSSDPSSSSTSPIPTS